MELIKNVCMIKCLVLMITFGIDMVMIYVLYKKIVYDTYDKNIYIYDICMSCGICGGGDRRYTKDIG